MTHDLRIGAEPGFFCPECGCGREHNTPNGAVFRGRKNFPFDGPCKTCDDRHAERMREAGAAMWHGNGTSWFGPRFWGKIWGRGANRCGAFLWRAKAMLFIGVCMLIFSADPTPQQRLEAAEKRYQERVIASIDEELASTVDRKKISVLTNKKKLIARNPPAPRLIPRQLQKGDIGTWHGGYSNKKEPGNNRFEVVQVIDDQNALVRSPNTHLASETGFAVHSPATMFWVSGHKFDDVTDGGFVSLPGLYEVVETKTYDTLIGTRTVWVVRKFSIE